jgi:hypothetical protein
VFIVPALFVHPQESARLFWAGASRGHTHLKVSDVDRSIGGSAAVMCRSPYRVGQNYSKYVYPELTGSVLGKVRFGSEEAKGRGITTRAPASHGLVPPGMARESALSRLPESSARD